MNSISSLVITLTIALTATPQLQAADHPSPSVNGEAALLKLKEGNQRFSSSKVSDGKPVSARRAETAKGQHPFAIIVACADSRTGPELVFDQNLGDLFVIRNAGNLADKHGLGSIEYAVEHLGTRLIVMLGHERCGAVTAALGSKTAPGNIKSLVRDIQPAVKAAENKPGDKLANTVSENARLVAAKIKSKTQLGHLASEVKIVPAVYDLDTGVIEWIPVETK